MKKFVFLSLLLFPLLLFGSKREYDYTKLYDHSWYRIYFNDNFRDCYGHDVKHCHVLIRLNGSGRWSIKRAWIKELHSFDSHLKMYNYDVIDFTFDNDPLCSAYRASFLCDNFTEKLSNDPKIEGISFAYK